ncbi:MAG: NAD(P)-binding domain-containing protein [Chloroflexota bacterium]
MNIAIVGTGSVGSALGRGWSAKGHMVTFASRDPEGEKATTLREQMPATVSVRGTREATSTASTIVLAIPYGAVPETLSQMGDLSGKVIVDCTNPIAPGLRSLVDSETSGAQEIAALVPEAKVIKAFNTIGAESMDNPILTADQPPCSFAVTIC